MTQLGEWRSSTQLDAPLVRVFRRVEERAPCIWRLKRWCVIHHRCARTTAPPSKPPLLLSVFNRRVSRVFPRVMSSEDATALAATPTRVLHRIDAHPPCQYVLHQESPAPAESSALCIAPPLEGARTLHDSVTGASYHFPTALEPCTCDVATDLHTALEWTRRSRDAIESKLNATGALIFRGFPLDTAVGGCTS